MLAADEGLLDVRRCRRRPATAPGCRTDASSPAVGEHRVVLTLGAVVMSVQVVLALQPLLHDLHVQQAQEAAAEAEAQRQGGLGLVAEGGVVELSFSSASRSSS